jgi:hypothetical protein
MMGVVGNTKIVCNFIQPLQAGKYPHPCYAIGMRG